jgi:hypothetical protein
MTRVINFKLTHSAVQTAASGHKRPVGFALKLSFERLLS